jgi:hypothetical protein
MSRTNLRSALHVAVCLLSLGAPALLLADTAAAPVSYPDLFISHVTPAVLGPGALFTVRGEGFGTSGSQITIGGVPCEVVSWTNTAVVARAPDGPVSGAVTLTTGFPVEVSVLYAPCTIVSWELGVIEARPPSSLEEGGKIISIYPSEQDAKVRYGQEWCGIEDRGDLYIDVDCNPLAGEAFPIRVDFYWTVDGLGNATAGWEREVTSPLPAVVLSGADDAMPVVEDVAGIIMGQVKPGQELTITGTGFGSEQGQVLLGGTLAPDSPDWDPAKAAAGVVAWSDDEVRFVAPDWCVGETHEGMLRIGAMLVPTNHVFTCVNVE